MKNETPESINARYGRAPIGTHAAFEELNRLIERQSLGSLLSILADVCDSRGWPQTAAQVREIVNTVSKTPDQYP